MQIGSALGHTWWVELSWLQSNRASLYCDYCLCSMFQRNGKINIEGHFWIPPTNNKSHHVHLNDFTRKRRIRTSHEGEHQKGEWWHKPCKVIGSKGSMPMQTLYPKEREETREYKDPSLSLSRQKVSSRNKTHHLLGYSSSFQSHKPKRGSQTIFKKPIFMQRHPPLKSFQPISKIRPCFLFLPFFPPHSFLRSCSPRFVGLMPTCNLLHNHRQG